MADNSEALRRARRQDSRIKRQRAGETIAAMAQAGEPITFPAVARRAGVSVSLLYTDPTLTSRIAEARERQRHAGPAQTWRLPTRSLISEQSLRTELANTKQQARRLTDEIAVLRTRLTRQLGADSDVARGRATAPLLEQLEQRASTLEADNHHLRQRVNQLETEVRELAETLDAARTMNRELIGELNRRPHA